MTVATWHAKSVPWMLAVSKATFLENYLAVSAWILNESSTECNAPKRSVNLSVYLVFNFEARRFYFLGENRLDAGAVENELSTFVFL